MRLVMRQVIEYAFINEEKIIFLRTTTDELPVLLERGARAVAYGALNDSIIQTTSATSSFLGKLK